MYSIASLCLFTNISQTLRVYNSRILTIKNVKFSFEYVFIWIYIHFNMYSFQYVFISMCIHFNIYSFQYIFISKCIHFNLYSFECIERFSNFYLQIFITQKQSFDFFCKLIDRFICDKDLRHKFSFEK